MQLYSPCATLPRPRKVTPFLRTSYVAPSHRLLGELVLAYSRKAPSVSGCSQQPIETRKDMSFSGRKSIVSLTFPFAADHAVARSHLLLCPVERRAQGSPVASGRVPGCLRASPKLLIRSQKVGCGLPTPRGKQPTSTGGWIYHPSEDRLAACMGTLGTARSLISQPSARGVSGSLVFSL